MMRKTSSTGSGSTYGPNRVTVSGPRNRNRTHPEAVSSGRQGSVCYHDEVVAACNIDVEQETDEVTVVVLTQAIVHPRAMVI